MRSLRLIPSEVGGIVCQPSNCREVWKMARPILVVDLETSGLDPVRDCIVEIGACLLDPDTLDEEGCFNARVRPTCPVSVEALRVHGLTAEVLAEAPSIDHAIRQFLDFAPTDALLAGHNVGFDVAFLKAAFTRTGLEYPFDYHAIDVWSVGFMCRAGMRNQDHLPTLDDFADALGLPRSARHTALEDAQITSGLLRKLRVASGEKWDDCGCGTA